MNIAWVMLTDGRPYVRETLPAWRENLGLDPIVVDDSGDPEQRAWLAEQCERVIPVRPQRAGYITAMKTVMNTATLSGADWIFLTEDDFLPEFPPDLVGMAEVLETHPYLCQMVLKRQPWYHNEVQSGGVLEALNDTMQVCHSSAHTWVEHQAFWSNNPMLFPVTIARRGWSSRQWSESWFGKALFEEGYRAGMWGDWGCKPQVQHIGVEKIGTDY